MTEEIKQDEPKQFEIWEIEAATEQLYHLAWQATYELNEKRRWSAQIPLPDNAIEQNFFWKTHAMLKQLRRDLLAAQVQLNDAQQQLAVAQAPEPVKRLKRKSDAA